jgi:hypothetical protein
MATPYSDLSGIFYVQQQYLADLSALRPSSTAGTDSLTYMQDLRTKLNTAYSGYQTASPSASAILDRQASMKSIIDNEVDRLNRKKASVDSAIFGQKRMAQFSDSYSKKYFAQTKILFVIIIVLIIYLGLTYLNNFIPVPTGIFVFVMLVIGGFALMVIVFTLRDINSRYNMDFDKLNLAAPSSYTVGGGITGNIYGATGGLLCVGESCCPAGNPTGAVWNKNTQQCLSFGSVVSPTTSAAAAAATASATKSGFTLMSQQGGESRQVSPYEPSEINSYTKI